MAQGKSAPIQAGIAAGVASTSAMVNGANLNDIKIIAPYGTVVGTIGALTDNTFKAMAVANASGLAIGMANSNRYGLGGIN